MPIVVNRFGKAVYSNEERYSNAYEGAKLIPDTVVDVSARFALSKPFDELTLTIIPNSTVTRDLAFTYSKAVDVEPTALIHDITEETPRGW